MIGTVPPLLRGAARWARVVVPLAILLVLLLEVSPREILSALAGIRPGPVAAALGLTLGSQVLVAARLRVLAAAQGLEMGTPELLRVNLAALFYSLFAPGGNVTGGAVRLYEVASRGGRGTGPALAAVLLDRLDATVANLAVGLAFLALARPGGLAGVTLVLVTLLGMGALAYLVLVYPPALRRLGGILGALEARVPTPAALRRAGLRGWKELRIAGEATPRVRLEAFALSTAAHLVGVATWVLLARAVGMDVGALTIGWVRTAILVLLMVPVSLGGLGVREAGLVILLAPYGVGADRAIAFSFLILLVSAALGVLGGLLQAGEAWWRRERD